jgi:hypothetical protein
MAAYPPIAITLPWEDPMRGDLVTVQLIFTTSRGGAINRAMFDNMSCRPALLKAGVVLGRATGMHALRHFYASALLDAEEASRPLRSTGPFRPGLHPARLYPPDAVQREARSARDRRSLRWPRRPSDGPWHILTTVSAGQRMYAGENPAYRSTRPSSSWSLP